MVTVEKGLVLRQCELGNADKLLTILFEKSGKKTVRAHGAKSLKSKLMPLASPFVYGEFSLTEKDGHCRLDGGEVLESFYHLRDRVEKVAFASYLCEVASLLCQDGVAEGGMLRLCLNTLFAAAERDIPLPLLKAAFEFRAAAECGFTPELDSCAACGAEAVTTAFSAEGGGFLCKPCAAVTPDCEVLSEPAAVALYQTVSCDLAKMYRFPAEAADSGFQTAAERFLLARLELKPKTLDFLHEMMKGM